METPMIGGVRGTVLIVDDEPMVLRMAAQALERVGYATLCAGTAHEAETICREHPGEIDALVMDVILETTRGYDAVPCLRTLRKALKVLYISGYPGQLVFELQRIPDPFLSKPFSPDALAAAVDRLIARDAGAGS